MTKSHPHTSTPPVPTHAAITCLIEGQDVAITCSSFRGSMEEFYN